MSLLFNADYEQQLFSNAPIKLESNRINQELEYFLFLLENDDVYTYKKYDNSYCSHIEKLGGKVRITTNKQNLKCWWGSYDNLEYQRFLNSKLTSTSLAIKNQACHPETQIINSLVNAKNNFLYKCQQGVSGKGIYQVHQQKKILYELQKASLIEEPLLDRNLDISYLHLEHGGIVYQNNVDEYFQYRGTTIGPLAISPFLQKKFLSVIESVKLFMQEHQATAPWSLDAFTYLEKQVEKLYGISEINYRKTMGYIAYKLHQKWYDGGVTELVLVPSNKVKKFNYQSSYELKVLSPTQNKFACFLLHGQKMSELAETKKKWIRDFEVSL